MIIVQFTVLLFYFIFFLLYFGLLCLRCVICCWSALPPVPTMFYTQILLLTVIQIVAKFHIYYMCYTF